MPLSLSHHLSLLLLLSCLCFIIIIVTEKQISILCVITSTVMHYQCHFRPHSSFIPPAAISLWKTVICYFYSIFPSFIGPGSCHSHGTWYWGKSPVTPLGWAHPAWDWLSCTWCHIQVTCWCHDDGDLGSKHGQTLPLGYHMASQHKMSDLGYDWYHH